MNYTLDIHPEAIKEFLGSVKWYDAHGDGLGERFAQEVISVLLSIQVNPGLGNFIRGKFRQAIVPVFPFVVVYKTAERKKAIYVSSIFHTSRNPAKKFRPQPRS